MTHNESQTSASGEPIEKDGAELSHSAGKVLPPAALRALEEAEARRRAAEQAAIPAEQGGPKGAEPTRFGDWERKGIAVDF